MKKLIFRSILAWLPIATAAMCIHGILYYALQQYIRLSANEVPAQYALSVVERLHNHMSPLSAIADLPHAEMEHSLAPFVIIYDAQEKPLTGTATLNGIYPAPPNGVFAYCETHNENRISWQPQLGIRNAAVIISCPITLNGTTQNGYVLAGQSLKETEDRERFLQMQIFAGIIVSLIATFVVTLMAQYLKMHTSSVNAI